MSDETHWQSAKEYRSETAGELADLVSILQDLKFTLRATDLILESTTENLSLADQAQQLDDEGLQTTSLWNSALVAYARCFGTGVRKFRLSVEMLDGLGDKAEDAKKVHSYFIELRNKYVAHSVNRFEETKIVLLIGDGIHSQNGVIGGGPLIMRPAAENHDNVRSLRNLAKFFNDQLELWQIKKTNLVIEEAKKLTEKELLGLPDMAIQIPVEPDEVKKPRQR